MKDLINKENMRAESSPDAEVAAFRALVSNNFDNSGPVRDTDTGKMSTPDNLQDPIDTPGRTGAGVEDLHHSHGSGLPGSNIHLSPGEVERLAAKALQVLAETPEGARQDAPLAQLFALTEAYIAFDEVARHEILARIMKRGVTANDVIEAVVPATARYMGELWSTDKLSFADVTIGTARLQETVRNIGTRRIETRDTDAEGPAIMLIVPRIEQHTLGVFVVAEQFRRLGVRVHMTLGNNQAEILRLVHLNNFALVGVTASCRRTLASVRDLVKTIRTGVPRITPIVIGGPVTDLGLDIIAMTGADFVAGSAEEALRLCKIETTQQPRLES
ncbi:cobalamin B12-binding domain-containing protein [Dinoroseobacter shibae]|jgi:methanogenic corrinoid protein MtbC1|nr:cobalamin B12-binding domain-containing protein [Dinoroseobacter shibae]URF46672.1 cobalamin B12-binding domain-containing protein [Dinoroseobacter shibae]URF50978.1 cobalamin B12-binding domain-containing protein [Dinoroseobacter shibae]